VRKLIISIGALCLVACLFSVGLTHQTYLMHLLFSNGATSAGYVEFAEDADNGTDTVKLIGPASTSGAVVTLPSTTGTLSIADLASPGEIGGTTPAAGHFTTLDTTGDVVLPQNDDAVTPTLAFGDGDSGFYESIDDTLNISIGGAVRWTLNAAIMYAASGGASFSTSAATSTSPTFYPASADSNTGVGRATGDQLSLIAGGVEGIRISENATIQVNSFGPIVKKYTITTDNTNGAGTHTIAELLGGLIRRGTGDEIAGAAIDVADTAANIVGGITGCAVGSGFEFSISNEDSTHTIQLDGGAGVTIAPNDPSTAIPANSTGRFLLVVTNATLSSEAVTVHALGFTTH